MIGKHTFKISVQLVDETTVMDVDCVFEDEQGRYFRDATWIGEVKPGKFMDAVCEVIKGTHSGKLRMFVPHLSENAVASTAAGK